MKHFPAKKLTALLSAVLLMLGSFVLPISVKGDQWNDAFLDWGETCVGEHTYDSDADYRCDMCGYYRIVITTAPKTATYAKDGAIAKVTLKAVGDGLKYQWYIRNASATKYSKSSITKATYSVTMSSKAHDRRLYCVITDNHGNEIQTATVLVRRQVTITDESATARYAKKGASASAKVTAVGEGLTYQWYVKNDGASKYTKSSITKATYSATMSSKVKGRRIYCVVKDKYGKSVQSKTFLLRESVSVTTQPKSVKVDNKKTAKVTVKASGDGLKYTWYVKNAGASKYTKSSITKSTYSVTMSDKVDGRRIYCVITDKYGKKVQTETVKLSKKAAPTYVWVSGSGSKYHSSKDCSNMKSPKKVTKKDAEDSNRTPCSKCY